MLTDGQAFLFVILLTAFVGVMAVWQYGWMGLLQTTIFLGVFSAIIYSDIDAPGYTPGVIAAIAAFALTVGPIHLYTWLRYGHVKRALYRELRAEKKRVRAEKKRRAGAIARWDA